MAKGGGQTPAGDYLMTQLPTNVERATNIANQPFTPYTGQLAAGVPGALTDAQSAARNLSGFKPRNVTPASSGVYGLSMGQPMQPAATGGSPVPATSPTPAPAPVMPAGLSDREQRQWQRGQRRAGREQDRYQPTSPQSPLGPTAMTGPYVSAMQGLEGLEAYFNPYIQSVINGALSDIDRSRQMALNQGASSAAMSGAFGGDRHGVADALTNEAYGRIAADTASGLRMGGFQDAAGMLMGDKDRLLQNQQFNATLGQQANLANQAAGLQAAQTNLAGAQTLGGLAMNQYGIDQAGLDAMYGEFLRQLNYPAQTQSLINAALGLVGPSMAGQYNEPQRVGSNLAGMASGFAQGVGTGMFMRPPVPVG